MKRKAWEEGKTLKLDLTADEHCEYSYRQT